MNRNHHFHFVGIGGAGMAPLAETMFRSGYRVSGSDLRRTETTQNLVHLGIPVDPHQRGEFVDRASTVVVSSAVTSSNCEQQLAVKLHKTIVHRSIALQQLSDQFPRRVFVSGTHGKTTTTAMLSFLLAEIGYQPTTLVGGQVKGHTPFGAHIGGGSLFIAEADESDKSMLCYHPTLAVLTNIDKDHLENYGSLDEIKKHFFAFCQNSERVVAFADDHNIAQILEQLPRQQLFLVGSTPDCDLQLNCIKATGSGCIDFVLAHNGQEVSLQLKSLGKHDATNAAIAVAAAICLGASLTQAAGNLPHFPGVARRLETIHHDKNFTIIDDYAHNPGKICSSIQSVREGSRDRVVAVFQPHRFSRLRTMYEDMIKSFAGADHVLVTPVYTAGEADSEFSINKLASDISQASSVQATAVMDFNRCIDTLLLEPSPSSVVTLGAGDIWKVAQQFRDKLVERSSSQ